MTFTLPSSSKSSASSQGADLGVRHANSSSLLISNSQELFTRAISAQTPHRQGSGAQCCEESRKSWPSAFFFLMVKIPFLPRGLDFLTKKHRLFNQRETSFSYILFPLFSSKTFASFLAALGDAGRRTPLLPWCRKPSFWVETLH